MSSPARPSRLARIVVRLHSSAVREEFGAEMADFVDALAAEPHFRGAAGRARLLVHLAVDVARRPARRSVPNLAPDRREDHMDSLIADLRYAIRTLARSRGFTVVAALTLLLGIGANTAIYSVVSAVLFRPLPYPAENRLTMVWGAREGEPQLLVSVPDFQEWRARTHSFEDMGIERAQSVNLTGTGAPDRLIGDFVDSHTLRILGATTVLGRLFTDGETAVGSGQPVAVISNAVWASRFGSDPHILGKTLVLNGRPHVVIGVLSADFQDPYGVGVYLPISSAPAASWFTRDDPEVWAVARLKPGVTSDAAQRDLASVAAQLAAVYPTTDAGLSAAVQPLRESLVGPVHSFLLIVLAAAGFVLLIACANVANLSLARAATRQREISLRAALGASRSRLVRQLLTESLVLAAVAGGAGVLVAHWGIAALVAAVPGGLPVPGTVGLDVRVLLFALAITAGAGLVFGAAPALFAARTHLNDALTTRTGDGAARGRVRFDLRSTFVAVQLALCIVLLVGAGLLVRSLGKLAHVDTGFDPQHVLTAEFRLPSNKYRTPEQIVEFMSRAIGEVRAVPGIRSAALVHAVPLSGNWASGSYIPDSRPGLAPDKAPSAQMNTITDDYFRTMRIHLAAGRDFRASDRIDALPVAIVNEQLARTAWPGEPAVGHRLHLPGPPDRWVTVVGVVADVKHLSVREPPTPQLYMPVAQQPAIFSSIVARTTGDPGALAGALRAAVWRVDPDQPVWKIRPLASLIASGIAVPRFTVFLTTAFAVLALLLAAVGVYGVMSYAVTQRTREVGIRMALGAQRGAVVRLILGRGARVVIAATIVGVIGAFGAARLIARQLFDVSAADPATFVIAPLVLAAVALVACWLPARRATKVDPVVALRSE